MRPVNKVFAGLFVYWLRNGFAGFRDLKKLLFLVHDSITAYFCRSGVMGFR